MKYHKVSFYLESDTDADALGQILSAFPDAQHVSVFYQEQQIAYIPNVDGEGAVLEPTKE